jgi:ribonuclease HI
MLIGRTDGSWIPGSERIRWGYTIHRGTLLVDSNGGTEAVGEGASGNYAEYFAVLKCLEKISEIKKSGNEPVVVFTDSMLVANQLMGRWKINAENLIPLHAKCKDLMQNFILVQIQYMSREKLSEIHAIVSKMSTRI